MPISACSPTTSWSQRRLRCSTSSPDGPRPCGRSDRRQPRHVVKPAHPVLAARSSRRLTKGWRMVRMRASWKFPEILLACALGVGVAACGSSAPKASTPAATPSATATSSAGGAASQLVTANWTAFFDAKTPVAKRVSLLQDGSQFASIISAQAGSSLASEASAKVTKVSMVSATQANVTYSILVSGQSMLPNQAGVAVLQGGTWKVGVASFCGLLTLENGGKSSSLPAACKTAG